MLGRTISHYKVLQKTGEGGMGVVYKAQDLTLDRVVALKFPAAHLMQNRETRERFIREAKAAAALDHPNICTVYEIHDAGGEMFIAMAYVGDQSLDEIIRSGPLEICAAINVAVDVARGLAAAHEKGLVHRDVKSANIMLCRSGSHGAHHAKLIDFGLASLSSDSRITAERSQRGTAAYMSPEQIEGSAVDHRTDIWGLGVVLYEMAAGRLPFTDCYAPAVMYSILHEQPEPLANLRADVPRQLRRILSKCLEKESHKRYSTAHDLLLDLTALRRNLESGTADTARTTPKRRSTVAVLPFVNLTGDPQDDCFGDGLTEELVNALARVKGVRVVSRTSTVCFKDKAEDVRRIGEHLRVKNVLEGSIRRVGRRVRVTVQLINAEDGFHLWSQRFDGQNRDVFALQDTLTKAIVERLERKLITNRAGGCSQRIRKRSARSLLSSPRRKEQPRSSVFALAQIAQLEPGLAG